MSSCPRNNFVDVEKHSVNNQISNATIRDYIRVIKPFIWPDNLYLKGKYKHVLRFVLISTYVLLIGGKLLVLLAPVFMSNVVENLAKRDYNATFISGTLYVTTLTFGIVFDHFRNLCYRFVQKWAVVDMSTHFIQHIFKMPYDWFVENNPAEISHVLNRGVESSRELTAYSVQLLVPAIFEIVGVSLIFSLKYKSPFITLITVGGIILYAVATISIANHRIKLRKKLNSTDNDIHRTMGDALANYETVRVFTNEDYEIEKYMKVSIAHERDNFTIYSSLAALDTIQEIIKGVTLLGVILMGVYNVRAGILKIGDVVAMIMYLFSIFRPLFLLGMIYMTILNAVTGLRDIISLSLYEVKIKDLPGAEELKLKDSKGNFSADIVFDNVYCPVNQANHFRGLRNVNFTIPSGTTCAIIGETGSGKTTISRLLYRFFDLDSGSIRINSKNISHVTQYSLRRSIGIVPQDTVLFHTSLYENIRYGKLDATREEVIEAADKAQLTSFIKALPSGIDTIVGERGLKLSGGERQRVAIARCFLKNPPIIILDEATSALDSKTEIQVQLALESLAVNRTVLVIAHRLSTIVNADQIIILSNGKIETCGTHAQLLETSKYYSDLWKSQLKSIQSPRQVNGI